MPPVGSSSLPGMGGSGTHADTYKEDGATRSERGREREPVMHLDTRWFISRSLFVLIDRKWIAEGQTVT